MHAVPDERAGTLVSFDTDGTLETGDPPGPVFVDVVRHARDRGYVIRRTHIGDTDLDRHFASLADVEFVHVADLPAPCANGWVV